MKNMRYSDLQIALLSILLEAKGDVTLKLIESTVYKKAGKRKPKTAHQAVSALIRATSDKLILIRAGIARKTPIGRGHEAKYALRGNIENVRTTLKALTE